MKCPSKKTIAELDSQIILTCDLDKDHWKMHYDQIHGVYWPAIALVREPEDVYRKRYTYESQPVPATISA